MNMKPNKIRSPSLEIGSDTTSTITTIIPFVISPLVFVSLLMDLNTETIKIAPIMKQRIEIQYNIYIASLSFCNYIKINSPCFINIPFLTDCLHDFKNFKKFFDDTCVFFAAGRALPKESSPFRSNQLVHEQLSRFYFVQPVVCIKTILFRFLLNEENPLLPIRIIV